MERKDAVEKLMELVESPSLIRHCYTVELVMRRAAHEFGHAGEENDWGLAGLLHDADYEKFPDEHPQKIVAWLRERGEEKIAYAISAHYTHWGVPWVSTMDKALLACDELTGFVVAAALIRPTGIIGLDSASVMKKFRTPKFAAGVSREEVTAGAEMLGIDLERHAGFVIDSLTPHAERLGLAGNRFDVGEVWNI